MSNKFDELAKGMAQSVTRRQALKKFSLGVVGIALACIGLANRAQAESDSLPCIPSGKRCRERIKCCSNFCGYRGVCA